MEEKKKTISIKLYLSLLYYDIKNKSYLTGRSRFNGQNHEEVANMKANDDTEDASQIMQSISNAVGILKSRMSEYLNDEATVGTNIPVNSGEAPDITTEKGQTYFIELSLKMPSNFNESTTDTIAKAAHQFVVNFSLADWFLITDKADAQDYSQTAQNNLELIREAINKRVRPERPKTPEDPGGGNSNNMVWQ